MKSIIFTLFLILTSFSYSQTLKFNIEGVKDTTVFLVKYKGSKLYYADTANLVNGVVTFDGSKQKAGMLGLLFPGQKLMEFIYNNEDVIISAKIPDFVGTTVVKKSEENKIFNAYVQYISNQKKQAQKLSAELKNLDKESEVYKNKEAELNAISKEVVAYQKDLVKNHSDMLVGKMINMTLEVEIPDAPVDENGKQLDSNFNYHYFRDHYFDHVDFSNDGLVNTPVFGNKIEYYFSNKMLLQHWDTILKYAYRLIDPLDPKSNAFEYTVSYVTSTFGNSQIMGMDKVFVMMADKYYCSRNEDGSSPAHWMTEEKLDELCENVQVQKNLVMGIVPPNIILPDTTDKPWNQLNWLNLHELDAEYTILYFWDPECGHCKKITPKLAKLYDEKFKERGIEVFAVGSATGDKYEKWKAFIRNNKMNFINVAVTETILKVGKDDARKLIPKYTTLESMNVHLTYDIYSTPQIYVLDKNKKIIAKRLTISQLEEMLDRLQGKSAAPKLFPPETDDMEKAEMH